MLIVGGKEAEAGTIAVRSRDEGDQGVIKTKTWINQVSYDYE